MPIKHTDSRAMLPPSYGKPIQLDDTIPQPRTVFTPETYRQFLTEYLWLGNERDKLRSLASQKYPNPIQRGKSPEYAQADQYRERLVAMGQQFFMRLPNYLIAVCPYCGLPIHQAIDHFSLMAFIPSLDITDVYMAQEFTSANLPRQWCVDHQRFIRVYINLHGARADDLPQEAIADKWQVRFRSAPSVIVWPLIARQTSAVIHALPIGRLEDPQPLHRYTAYFVTYFEGNDSNYGSPEMYVKTKWGGPAAEGVQFDTNLVKWVRAGRLFWLNPNHPRELLRGPVEAFPYDNIQPQGWYEILKGGGINGPNPYYQIWQGEAPPHDVSYPKTIE